MKMILRPDLRCPKHCAAAVVEMRHENGTAEFRCKVHGALLPPIAPIAHWNHPALEKTHDHQR